MATDYFKLELLAKYSKSSDYSNPKAVFDPDAYEITPDEYDLYEVEANAAAVGSGTTVTLSKYATIKSLMIKNLSSSLTVSIRFQTIKKGATDIDMDIEAGGIVVLMDITPSANLNLASPALGAAAECEVMVAGT